MSIFDTSYDFKTDNPGKKDFDADRDSETLKSYHELLWRKELPSGVLFEPKAPSSAGERRKNYLRFEGGELGTHVYGSDAITNSYTRWIEPKALADAIASLDENQRSRYLNPPYTIGSAMIWPVRTKDRYTINTARRNSVGDRMDLTLECIRRHYAKEEGNRLSKATDAYADFFDLFVDFQQFVDFFHFQDLVTPNYEAVEFFLPLENFNRPATPTSDDEYVEYREKVLEFIEGRNARMANWVRRHSPEVEVRG